MNTVARKRQLREQEIYDTAARLFAERGYHATRIQDIADELALQKGSLYYYVSSKEDLLVGIVERRVGTALETMRAIVAQDGSSTEKLALAVREHLRIFSRHADIYSIFLFEKLNAINAQAAEVVDRLGREYEALWYRLLSEGVACGEFRADLDQRVLVKALMGMCNSTLIWFNPQGRLPVEAVADVFARLVLTGLQRAD